MKKQKMFRATKPTGRTFDANAVGDSLYKTSYWKSHRMDFLKINPRCYGCGQKSTVVDHCKPHKGDFSVFWKEDNFIPLCEGCHNTVTSLFDRNWRPGNSINQKLTWFKWQRAKRELSFRVKVVPFHIETLRWINSVIQRKLEVDP